MVEIFFFSCGACQLAFFRCGYAYVVNYNNLVSTMFMFDGQNGWYVNFLIKI